MEIFKLKKYISLPSWNIYYAFHNWVSLVCFQYFVNSSSHFFLSWTISWTNVNSFRAGNYCQHYALAQMNKNERDVNIWAMRWNPNLYQQNCIFTSGWFCKSDCNVKPLKCLLCVIWKLEKCVQYLNKFKLNLERNYKTF